MTRFHQVFVVVVGLLLFAGSVAGGAEASKCSRKSDEGYATRLGEATVIRPQAHTGKLGVNVSDDGQVTTILTDVLASIDDGVKTDSVVKTAVLRIPVKLDKKEMFLGYHSDLRGSISKDKGCRVTILLEMGGTACAMEFPFGEEREGEIEKTTFTFAQVDKQIVTADDDENVDEEDDEEDEEEESIDQTGEIPVFAPPPHYTAVLCIIIQRRSKEDLANVQIDSLEVEIVNVMKDGSEE